MPAIEVAPPDEDAVARLPVWRRSRQEMRTVKAGLDEPLEDMYTDTGRVAGAHRCQVLGLPWGDCQNTHSVGSRFCYYHDKVAAGLIVPDVTSQLGAWPSFASISEVYPQWPLRVDLAYRMKAEA